MLGSFPMVLLALQWSLNFKLGLEGVMSRLALHSSQEAHLVGLRSVAAVQSSARATQRFIPATSEFAHLFQAASHIHASYINATNHSAPKV